MNIIIGMFVWFNRNDILFAINIIFHLVIGCEYNIELGSTYILKEKIFEGSMLTILGNLFK